MLKVAIPVAAVLVIAYGWLMWWIGKEAGKKIGARNQSRLIGSVDVGLHHQLIDYLITLFAAVDNLDEFVMMPPRLKARGQQLLDRHQRNQRHVAR